MKYATELIMFDLGGVLIELGNSPIPRGWLPNSENFNLSDWFLSPTALAFECGHISAAEFAYSIKTELSLIVDCSEIIDKFTQWPKAFFPDSTDILIELRGKYRLALFSNTNELHWSRFIEEFEIHKYFDHLFASHLLKAAKPDIESFHQVLDSLKVAPDKVLFFDDNSDNISSAKRVGINAVLVSGTGGIRSYLKAKNMLQKTDNYIATGN